MNGIQRPSRAARRGFLLVIGLVSLVIGGLLIIVISQLLLSSMQIQQAALAHSGRMATTQALVRSLRHDALAAEAMRYAPDRRMLLLRVGSESEAAISYHFAPDQVVRRQGSDERIWQAKRLIFAWSVEVGPDGGLGRLEITEQHPRRRVVTYDRFSVPISLPKPLSAEQSRGATSREDQP